MRVCDIFQAVPSLKKYETMKVEQITITPDETMLYNIKQESKDENQIDQEENTCQDMFEYNDDSESDLVKSESKNESKDSGILTLLSEKPATFSCKHCNENFDQARLLILHISENHKEDSNVKNLAKKQKNQKTPCGECGKLYSDSGLRAHMIRVSVLKTIQLLSPKLRNHFFDNWPQTKSDFSIAWSKYIFSSCTQ